ncbi:MAG: bacteriohemerythrin [Candidatus Scalindua sp.]
MIEWSNKYSVGVSVMDEEHKGFIGILNKVIAAKQRNYSQEEIEDILGELVKFAKEHFQNEEACMSKFEYPDYLSHYNEHMNFSLHMIIYNNQVINGEYKIMGELYNYLQEWLVHHIQKTDKKYTKCFNKNGLK